MKGTEYFHEWVKRKAKAGGIPCSETLWELHIEDAYFWIMEFLKEIDSKTNSLVPKSLSVYYEILFYQEFFGLKSGAIEDDAKGRGEKLP